MSRVLSCHHDIATDQLKTIATPSVCECVCVCVWMCIGLLYVRVCMCVVVCLHICHRQVSLVTALTRYWIPLLDPTERRTEIQSKHRLFEQ